jgi:hypothetical protein
MVQIYALWIPILLSAVLVFFASFIVHMVAWVWHKNDYAKVPNEERVAAALRPFALPPADYMMPRCETVAEMKTPEFAEKLNKGPVMIFTVMPNGPFSMTQNLIQWFIYSILVGVVSGYVAGQALDAGAGYAQVFRVVAGVAFAAYAVGLWQLSIWYKRSWATTIRYTIDGLLYALLTAGSFGWLWPR